MRQARFLAPGAVEGRRAGIYHCVSRVVDRRFVLERAEKEQFVKFMRLYENFCGVRVLAFCVMSNHFHLLLEVPPRPEGGLSDGEFFRRLALLYSEVEVEEVRGRIQNAMKLRSRTDEVAAIKEKYLYRMWDLSQFMKSLKQRFTQWFNKRHERTGTLWEARFKSVIVEDGYAARVMAAYIDLNPVRAGIVATPEQYRWCSYGEALAGKRPARTGIERVMREFDALGSDRGEAKGWREVIASYRVILYSDGEERVRTNENTATEEVARRGVSSGQAAAVRARAGKLGGAEILRHRIRHFVDGTAIGTESFVNEVFAESRTRFGPKRTSGARKIRGCDTPLRALRDLRSGTT